MAGGKPPIQPGHGYKGRALEIKPVQLSLDKEAWELLQLFATTKKSHGKFLSRLVYEHVAVQAERRRLLELVPVVQGEDPPGED